MLRTLLRRRGTAGRLPTPEEHRDYVGGLWEEIGRLQFSFMVDQGLRPGDVLLDIACGSLRAGVHFIPYLDAGNYLGLDREQRLIDLGIERELGRDLALAKRPQFVVSDSFEFAAFDRRPRFSLAQSLFTHLVARDVARCLRNLRAFVGPDHTFYATYFAGDDRQNPLVSHDHGRFAYSTDQLSAAAEREGWRAEPLGEWGHPRGQLMMRFDPR